MCLDTNRDAPKISGDSDIMFTSIEGDEFDEKESRRMDP
jgi:hypothetical protein